VETFLYIIGIKLSKLVNKPVEVHLWWTEVVNEPFEHILLTSRKGSEEAHMWIEYSNVWNWDKRGREAHDHGIERSENNR
jgi:hypothetical protein